VTHTRSIRAAALALLAAVAISACGQVRYTGGTAVAGTLSQRAGLPAAAPQGNPASPPPAAPSRWRDVTGWVQLAKDSHGGQFGTAPYPGINVSQDQGLNVDTADCTAGLPVADGHGRHGFLTAGHCDKRPGATVYIFDASGTQIAVGSYSGALQGPQWSLADDTAVLWADTPVASDSDLVAHRFKQGRPLSVSEVRDLPLGTPVCIDGAYSGVVCSALTGHTDTEIEYGNAGQPGDSGAMVFVVDAATSIAYPIGTHSGRYLGNGQASYTQSQLTRLNAVPLFD
jgi:hypothetical protein